MTEYKTVPDDLLKPQNGRGRGNGATTDPPIDGVVGIKVLQGAILYAAVLTFAVLYVHFIVLISDASGHTPPKIDGTLLGTAAALSGVLGSAFALRMGVNRGAPGPDQQQQQQAPAAGASRVGNRVKRVLAFEIGGPSNRNWPLTVGIWTYAAVASAVVIAYALNQDVTPGGVKALAVVFGGYVLALIHAEFGV
jgi:hypothetical protein